MDRSERFQKIQRMLRTHRYVSTPRFLEKLEVSLATFKRDVQYMRDRLHVPLIYDRELQAYCFDDKVADHEVFQLPGLWFTADELQALLTMDQLLGALEPGLLTEHTRPMREKLRSLLKSSEHSADEIARRIRILSMASRRVQPANFRTLSTGVLSRRRLRIVHVRRPSGERLEREVSPQRLVHYRDNWYLDAWCHTRNALRSFGVDAIESARVSEQAADEIADDVLDRHFAAGYGIFAGAQTQQAVLLFTAMRASWVAGEIWHPEQEGQLQTDGSYLLKLPYSQEPELLMDILKYGADVEVLAPSTLRERVQQELRQAAARY